MRKILCYLSCFLFALGMLILNQSAKAMPGGTPDGYKVVFVGDTGVGKTSIIKRMLNYDFNANEESTIGAAFDKSLSRIIDGNSINLNIWDTAGQERYHSFVNYYMHNASIAIVVCSVDDPDSQQNVKTWINRVQDNIGLGLENIIVVLNKADLKNESEESDFTPPSEVKFLETSAKNGYGISDLTGEIFYLASLQIQNENEIFSNVVIGNQSDAPPKSCC